MRAPATLPHYNVLVTGGAGFIGSNVARALGAAGHRVVISDRLRSGVKWRSLVDIGLHDIITPDVTLDWLAHHATDIDVVIHLGAVSATTETDIDRIMRDNIRLSIDLWSWCSRHHIRFIYASSAATYGNGSLGFQDDEHPDSLAKLRPLNAYGWSKNMVDRRFIADLVDGRSTPPQWAGLKFFNVYGPGEDHKGDMRSVVIKMLPTVAKDDGVKLFRSYRTDYPDGGQKRDFVYVDDAVAAIAWLLDNPGVSGIFNVGSGEARTFNDLALAVFGALQKKPTIEYVDMPESIRRHYQYYTSAPMDKLRSRGWARNPVPIEEGVRRYAQWWLDRHG